MTSKTTVWLFFLVCLCGVLIWTLDRRVASTQERRLRDTRLFTVDPGRALALELATHGFRVVCAKRDDEWYLDRPLIGRADSSRIDRMLASLESMRRIETITADQRRSRELSLGEYGFEPPAAIMVVRDGLRHQELWIGGPSPLGDGLYVKFARSEDVLVTQTAILKDLPATLEDMRDRSLFPGDAFRTSRLEIKRAEGGFTQLARVDGTWMIQQPFQANADDAKIEGMLRTLYAARIGTFVWDRQVESPEGGAGGAIAVNGNIVPRADAYGLVPDDASARIAVWTAGSDIATELLLGKVATENGSAENGETYAKFSSKDSIFTVDKRLLATFSVAPGDLRDKNLFSVKADDIQFVAITQGEERVVLQRAKGSDWMLAQPFQWRADNATVDEFVRRVTRLRAEQFLEGAATNLAAEGLSPARVLIRIDSKLPEVARGSGLEPATPAVGRGGHVLCVGRLGDDATSVYAKFQDEDTVFMISAQAIDELGVRMADPLVYRDRTVLAVVPDNIKRITLSVGGDEQGVARTASGGWTVEGNGSNEVDAVALTTVLLHMANLRAARIDSRGSKGLAAYGLDPADITLTLGLSGEEGIQKKLLMGFRAGSDGVYAMVQGQDVVFVLPTETFVDLTRKLTRPVASSAPPPDDLSRQEPPEGL